MDPSVPEAESKGVPSETIKVSNKRSLFYYVSESSKSLAVHNTVEVSGLGGAIPTVVSIVEILKNQGLCKIKSVSTSFANLQERRVQKPKIEIVIEKSDNFVQMQAVRNQLQEENAEIHQLVAKAQRAMQAQLTEEQGPKEEQK